jgi:cell division protein FtsI/penicillin-binding protein 2
MEGGYGTRPTRRRRRRRRLLTRTLPIAIVAGLGLAAGIIYATAPGRAERRLVTRYVDAWSRSDYRSMYSLLDTTSRRQISFPKFVAAYRAAAGTATLTSVVPGALESKTGNLIPVRMLAHTRLFGSIRETLDVPLTGSGSGAKVHFARTLLFPGLAPGERLTRQVQLPPRAALLASDGTPLAQGPDRSSPIPDVASQIVGTLGPTPAGQQAAYASEGYPPDASVGIDGLERIFQTQLAGMPGGTLLVGRRVLARTAPVPGHDVTTTIDPTLERAAIAAMGGQYSGIAAMDPRTGGLLALAGIAFSAPQPPGSTMKMITVTGALQAGIVKLTDTFPIATSATIDGFTLNNAGGEACGGTLLNAFAVSCNSVFAPLGARLGGQRLVAIAERFGFNQPASIPGAAESQIPPANQIGNALAVGSSAIGQGKVQTTPLEMADVGATIAMGGRRPIPTLLAHQPPQFVPVTSARVATLVQRMMIAVVQFGTGTAAQIPGVTVAGKTGTAELVNTSAAGASTAQNTDAWFVGYAPVGAPRIVVGALFPNQGAGGATAAPAVRQVLVAALQAH